MLMKSFPQYAPTFRILLFGSLLFCFSCKNPRLGALSPVTRTEIQMLASSGSAPEEKYDKLARKMSVLLKEGAAMKNDGAMMDHFRSFYQENELALKDLQKQFDPWLKHLEPDEMNDFIIELNSHQYAIQLRDLRKQIESRLAYNKDFSNEFATLMSPLDYHR